MVSAFFSLLVTRLDARNREKRIKVRKRVIQLLKKKKNLYTYKKKNRNGMMKEQENN